MLCNAIKGGISRHLSAAFILLAAGPVVLLSIILPYLSYVIQREQTLGMQREVSEVVAKQIVNYFHGLEDVIALPMKTVRIMEQDRGRQFNVLSVIRSHRNMEFGDVFDDLVLLDRKGKELAYVSRVSISTYNDLGERSLADEFLIPVRSGRVYYGPFSTDRKTGEPFITMGIPIPDVRSGLADGVLLAKVRLKGIRDFVAKMNFGDNGNAYIIDREGIVIAHKDPSLVLKGTRFRLPEQDGIYKGVTGGRVVVAAAEITLGNRKLYIVTERPFSEAFRLTQRILLVMGMLFVVALAGVVSFGLFVRRQIVAPLKTLADTAAAISGGDLSRRTELTTDDELGVLSRAFNEMAGQLTAKIGSLKQHVKDLQESRAQYREISQEFHTLLDAIPDVLFLVSPDLKILWANKSASLSCRSEIQTPTGRYCYELWHDNSGPCEGCNAIRSFNTGNAENRVSSTGGRTFDSRSFPIKNENGHVEKVIVVTCDITENINLQSEAVRSAQLASIGELAAGVAHEINNPINGIINYAQILSNKLAKETRENDIAGRIIREGNRIAAIVSGLLSFAREKRDERRTVGITEILSESLTLTEVRMKEDGIHLKVDIPHDLPGIIANPQQIQQVFMNIISNARYALDQKCRSDNERKTIEISGEKVDKGGKGYVRVIFHDSGTGISSALIDKVMSPFVSTKPEGMGTGLGLSISHGIIRNHGGVLTLESTEGEFTNVIIELPAAEASFPNSRVTQT
ncbi:MAG: sensor histidine kinase [Nitrospiraceae bacterium]|nr:MAG: sensor histidine kinase [Nitrospiraceae bacterium]